MKDESLPKFSDTDCFADRYNSQTLMQTDLSRNAQKSIIDRFEEIPPEVQKNIRVDHFSLNWKPYQLKSKIEDFNENPKEVGGHPVDDLFLAEQLAAIVDRYSYAIDDYVAVRYMIDEQFERTKVFVFRQAFIYITFFFVPLLLQIFCLNDYPTYVFYCLQSCLFVTVLFLGVEFVQFIQSEGFEYFFDGQNQIDMLTLFTFLYYYVLRFYDQGNSLVRTDGDQEK